MCGAAAIVDSEIRLKHACYNLYSTVEMLMTRDGPGLIDAKSLTHCF